MPRHSPAMAPGPNPRHFKEMLDDAMRYAITMTTTPAKYNALWPARARVDDVSAGARRIMNPSAQTPIAEKNPAETAPAVAGGRSAPLPGVRYWSMLGPLESGTGDGAAAGTDAAPSRRVAASPRIAPTKYRSVASPPTISITNRPDEAFPLANEKAAAMASSPISPNDSHRPKLVSRSTWLSSGNTGTGRTPDAGDAGLTSGARQRGHEKRAGAFSLTVS